MIRKLSENVVKEEFSEKNLENASITYHDDGDKEGGRMDNKIFSSPEGKNYLVKMMMEIDKYGFELYITKSDDQEIHQAVNFYFDHLIPFVKMLGNDYEADVSKMMGQIMDDRGLMLSEQWEQTRPVLKQAMNLLA